MNRDAATYKVCPIMSTGLENGIHIEYCRANDCAIWEPYIIAEGLNLKEDNMNGQCGLITKSGGKE